MTQQMNSDNAFLRVKSAAIAVYGEIGWQRAVARDYNYPQSQLSKLNAGHISLTPEAADKLASVLVRLEQAENALRTNAAMTMVKMVERVPGVNFDEAPVGLRDQIKERFDIIDSLTIGVVERSIRTLIISGPAGLGKSFGVMKILREAGKPFITVTGEITAIGLYMLMYKHRNDTILFDDCDKFTEMENMLNMIKGATNLDDNYRQVSWANKSSGIYAGSDDERLAEIERVKAQIEDEKLKDEPSSSKLDRLGLKQYSLEEAVPNHFSFNGGVIFITNKSWTKLIKEEHRNAEHMKAIIDRGYLLSLNMEAVEMKLERIAQGIEELGILDKYNVDRDTVGAEIMAFIRKHADKFQNLSFRTAEKIAPLYKTSPNRWQRITAITQFDS